MCICTTAFLSPVCEIAKEIQLYRTVFWALWEREGGMIWENGIKTCIISYKKPIASPGFMQDTGKMVWYSHLFKNFPQFVVIHTVKGFHVVNETVVDVFLEFTCFLYDPANVGNLISDSSAFSKPSLYIWKFSIQVC